ncbi:MAG: serine protease [Thiobacillaceae bacterium]
MFRLLILSLVATLGFCCQTSTAANVQETDASTVFKSASRSVVLIMALSDQSTLQGSGVAFRNGFSAIKKPDSTWIVTNAHVVRGAKKVYIVIEGEKLPVAVAYVDDEFDLALLHLQGKALPIIPPDSSSIEIGARVYSIGSPLGLENSISEGIVSGKRERNGIPLIQTTAPISHGNSGGGLFDNKSRFIGITTFKLADGENLNFAVDSSYLAILFEANGDAEYLRIISKGEPFTPTQTSLIQSPELTKWLLRAHAENGQLMYQKAKTVFTGSSSADELFAGANEILSQFLSRKNVTRDTPSSTLTADSQQSGVQLVCTMTGRTSGRLDSGKLDLNVYIDYRLGQVNGNPARIDDGRVAWQDKGRFRTEINRYTGSISVTAEDGSDVFDGSCHQATDKQF